MLIYLIRLTCSVAGFCFSVAALFNYENISHAAFYFLSANLMYAIYIVAGSFYKKPPTKE